MAANTRNMSMQSLLGRWQYDRLEIKSGTWKNTEGLSICVGGGCVYVGGGSKFLSEQIS